MSVPTPEEIEKQATQLQASVSAVFRECRRQINENVASSPFVGSESAQDCAARFARDIANTLDMCKRCEDSSKQAGLQKEIDELTHELQEKVSEPAISCCQCDSSCNTMWLRNQSTHVDVIASDARCEHAGCFAR